uniref:Uncharacterized protein n=1 Tax=Romanomermis culicivorax TaxID=13658 RepID=A0A915JCJ0_ROMCU
MNGQIPFDKAHEISVYDYHHTVQQYKTFIITTLWKKNLVKKLRKQVLPVVILSANSQLLLTEFRKCCCIEKNTISKLIYKNLGHLVRFVESNCYGQKTRLFRKNFIAEENLANQCKMRVWMLYLAYLRYLP